MMQHITKCLVHTLYEVYGRGLKK